jgi:uncharacterized protein (TIGR03083 family)
VADEHVEALRSSVARLRDLTSTLSEGELSGRAYPAEWSIAQVLSHIGSGAVIMQRSLEDTLAGRPTPDEFAPEVWDAWNAKTPAAQRDDALAADADLLASIEALTPEQRSSFSVAMGPMTMNFHEYVGLRLNEHAFHTWDIEVALDPAATIPPEAVELVVENLELIARYTGKPTGDTATISVTTIDPQLGFTIDLTPESVTFRPGTASLGPDLELPAEAFARLIYGRLDPEHTGAGGQDPALDLLRRVFPGP